MFRTCVLLCSCLLTVVLMPTGSIAQDSPQYGVEIGYKSGQLQGQITDIPITLHSIQADHGLGGFDFLIGYRASHLLLQEATPGDVYDECAWEYFAYHFESSDSCGGTCPTGMVRVAGVANENDGSNFPGCDVGHPGYIETVPTTLATLRFLVSENRTLPGRFLPISFFWTECKDNVLSNFDGREAFLSSVVYDREFIEPFVGDSIRHPSDFPTYRGIKATLTAEECYSIAGQTGIASANVRFQNGGIGVFGEYFMDRGDLNMNGLAFEIADAVMFVDYFVEGLSAFGNHVEGSIAASDCNVDGVTLSVVDFVHLWRTIVADGEPYAGLAPSPNPAYFSLNQVSDEVAVTTTDELGAVRLIVEGEITPVLLTSQMKMRYASDTGFTKILIYPWALGVSVSSGPLVSLPGSSGIVEVETATFLGQRVTAIVGSPTAVDHFATDNLPAEFALHANYPNPFNPNTTIAYDLPRQFRVVIAIYNIAGQRVKTLVDGIVDAGHHTVVWDGRDRNGHLTSSGIYLYRLQAGDAVHSRKMLLLK